MTTDSRRIINCAQVVCLILLLATPVHAQQAQFQNDQFRNNNFRNNNLGNNGFRNGPPRLPDNVVVERDIEYRMCRASEVLKLDIVRPKDAGEKPLPVVAYVHGGAWRSGSKDAGLAPVGSLVATGNYVGVSIGYRLSGEAIWPAQIHDCKAAIRWLALMRRSITSTRTGSAAWGGSSGGHLVSLIRTSADVSQLDGACGTPGVSSRVQCVVDFCGTADFAFLIDQAPSA